MPTANEVTVRVWNTALLRLGQPLMAGPDDETEVGARVRIAWDSVRPAMLRAYPWNCAMRRAALPRLAVAPAWEYANAYPVPADFLLLWRVNGQKRGAWTLEGGQILTDLAAPLRIQYVADIQAHQMDPALAALAALELAHLLSQPLTSNTALADKLYGELQRTRVETRAMDARENNEQQRYDRDDIPDWLDVRR